MYSIIRKWHEVINAVVHYIQSQIQSIIYDVYIYTTHILYRILYIVTLSIIEIDAASEQIYKTNGARRVCVCASARHYQKVFSHLAFYHF